VFVVESETLSSSENDPISTLSSMSRRREREGERERERRGEREEKDSLSAVMSPGREDAKLDFAAFSVADLSIRILLPEILGHASVSILKHHDNDRGTLVVFVGGGRRGGRVGV